MTSDPLTILAASLPHPDDPHPEPSGVGVPTDALRALVAERTTNPLAELIEVAQRWSEARDAADEEWERGFDGIPVDSDIERAESLAADALRSMLEALSRSAGGPNDDGPTRAARMIAEVQAEHARTWPSCATDHGDPS